MKSPILLFYILYLAIVSVSALPAAVHFSTQLTQDGSVLIQLKGYDATGGKVRAVITKLPDRGMLYQVSQVYAIHTYDPKTGDPISSVNTAVNSLENKIIFKYPTNQPRQNGRIARFWYKMRSANGESNEAMVDILDSNKGEVVSSFDLNDEGWKIINNNGDGVHYERSRRGLLNHYIYGSDKYIDSNSQDGSERTFDSLWYFQSPSKYHDNLILAYGGYIEFTISSAAGDFTNLNSNVYLVRIISTTSTRYNRDKEEVLLYKGDYNGSTKVIRIPLTEQNWKIDTHNTNKPLEDVSLCHMVEVLEKLDRIEILGDYTKWYESIALDDISIIAGNGVPSQCYL